MATRSTITVQHTNGTFKKVYCHWDGYLENNGATLRDHYNTQELAEEVVGPGDMSSLHEKCNKPEGHSYDKPVKGYTVYYGRDRGEDGADGSWFTDLESVLEDGGEEYNYLWKDGQWHLIAGEYGNPEIITLEEAFNRAKEEEEA